MLCREHGFVYDFFWLARVVQGDRHRGGIIHQERRVGGSARFFFLYPLLSLRLRTQVEAAKPVYEEPCRFTLLGALERQGGRPSGKKGEGARD